MQSTARISRNAALISTSEATRTALAAAALGLIVLWAVGFAPIETVHNAAHDTRHAMAFPCH